MMDTDPEKSAEWMVSSGESELREAREKARRDIVRKAYVLLRKNFWVLYAISVPPAVFAIFVNMGRDILLQRLFRNISFTDLLQLRVVFPSLSINFTSYFLMWLFESFAFAAIAATVMGISDASGPLHSDGYTRARERIGAITYVAFTTFLRFAILLSLLVYFVLPATYKVLPYSIAGNHWFGMAEGAVFVLLVAAAIMGYAFAIPIVVATDESGHRAMKESWRLTDGRERSLFRLIFESLFAGLLGVYLASWFTHFVLQKIDLHGWAGWIQVLLTALIGAAAQIPMFVGFALLYEKASTEKANVTSEAAS